MSKFKITEDSWLVINGKFSANPENVVMQSINLEHLTSVKVDKFEPLKNYSICLGVGDGDYLFIQYTLEEFDLLKKDLRKLEEYIGKFADWGLL